MRVLARAKIDQMAMTPRDGYKVLHFKISGDLSDFYPLIDKLPDNAELCVSTTSSKSQRAHNYYWSIVGDLAYKLETPKTEVHKHLIREFGTFQDEDYPNSEVDKQRADWEARGTGWVTDIVWVDEDFTTVRFYYGMSSYDSHIMRIFLNFVYEYALECGVDKTILGDRATIDQMASRWGK